MDNSTDSIVFVHIPRTGGTALMQAMYAVVGESHLAHGHFILDEAYHWPIIAEQNKTITVLRDPIDRLISLYYRYRLDPGYPYHKELQTMSLADFVASGQHVQTYQADNDQVRRLSGVDFDSGENCWGAVDQAMRNLESFTVVGVYGWTVPLRAAIREHIGLTLPTLPHVSVDQERPTTGQLDTVDLEAIQEYNQLDLMLYSMAVARAAADVYEQSQNAIWDADN